MPAKAKTAKEKPVREKTPRRYYVWRPDARARFRTYRVRARRPAPQGPHLLWQGDDYAAGLRVQMAANEGTRAGRRHCHPDQGLLHPEFYASFAAAPDGRVSRDGRRVPPADAPEPAPPAAPAPRAKKSRKKIQNALDAPAPGG